MGLSDGRPGLSSRALADCWALAAMFFNTIFAFCSSFFVTSPFISSVVFVLDSSYPLIALFLMQLLYSVVPENFVPTGGLTW